VSLAAAPQGLSMNHRSLVLFVSLLAAGSVGLRAQTAPPEPAPAAPSSAWVITPALTSQYMFRGVRLGGPSFQPAVEFDAGGLAAGVWANFPLQDKVAGQSDPEFDFYASYVIEAVKDTLTWQPGVTFYIYPNAEKKNGFYPTSLEPNLALNYTVSGVKFTPKLYYDVVLKGPTYELTAAYALPLEAACTELVFTGTVGTFRWTDALADTTPAARNRGNYWWLGVAAPFQINPRARLTLGGAYTKGSENFVQIGAVPQFENTAAVGRGVGTISCAFTL
jgi:uncharacterized protein (TIGR02001 family)